MVTLIRSPALLPLQLTTSLSLDQRSVDLHTHTHTHAHTCTHVHTSAQHTNTRAHAHAHVHARSTRAHTHTHLHTHTHVLQDQTCIIWDINKMVFVRQLREHTGPVTMAVINQSNVRRLLTIKLCVYISHIIYICTWMRTHTHLCSQKHAHTHTHVHAHTHTGEHSVVYKEPDMSVDSQWSVAGIPYHSHHWQLRPSLLCCV